jgi:ATP-dependent DNA helicase RecQ
MAVEQPINSTQMLHISGVGNSKLERYGYEFIEVIRDFAASPLSAGEN